MSFIHDDFLLATKTARRLYHEYAADEPILDYHTHLPPGEIAENRRFRDLAEVWLGGDHYKWRAMRAAGVTEDYCTGEQPPFEKFMAWARTVPLTLRNPLYHWTHMELVRYFGINDLLDEKSAPKIWEAANAKLATDELTPRGIFKSFKVRCVCTTDDPCDDLKHHKQIAASELSTAVYPTFRPDRVLDADQPKVFNGWIDRLEAASGASVGSLNDLLDALRSRHDYFHAAGCRLSDHGLETCYAADCTQSQAAAVFDKVRGGAAAEPDEQQRFASYMMHFFGVLDAEKGWTKQLHLGALRNANSHLMHTLGRDVGGDSIGDWPQADALAAYLGRLAEENSLPKVVLYNLNPADNAVFATMAGNFQDGSVAGKVQWGSGWWFLDQWDGMTEQMNMLSNQGLLSQFIGMLTDSRSFLSYPRHEYFRRCLCNLLGKDVERGAIPDSEELLAPLVKRICYGNAHEYLGLDC